MSDTKRITLYTLTIHKNDISKDNKKLFDKDYLAKYCRDIFKPNTECYFINHNQDIDLDTGEIKEEHIHLAIKFPYNAGKTFSRMKTLFPNSHIEECYDFDNGVLYLTHETINAKNDGKTLYSRVLVFVIASISKSLSISSIFINSGVANSIDTNCSKVNSGIFALRCSLFSFNNMALSLPSSYKSIVIFSIV